VPPRGAPQEFVEGLPIGAGFRVPCIIVSPWTAGGYVCSQQFDHTSVLRLLEEFTGVRETNISEWRRGSFGSLTSALRFQNARAGAPLLPDTSGPLGLAKYESAVLPKPVLPGQNQQFPQQEREKDKEKDKRKG
jgi:phospholipase C